MDRRDSRSQQARQPKGWWQQYLAWSGKKKTPAQQKPRVRLRLLLLLWVWAALMFVVVDLFYNVPEFDRIRPRADAYRAMRHTAHEMVGRSYTEEDGFARESQASRAGVRSDNYALAEVREKVRLIASEGRRDPYLAVPAATLERVDMREVEPPPQFKGTPLEWRLHGKMDPEELAGLLRSLRELGPRDRRAVLHRLFREPDLQLASALVEARKGLDGPPLLLSYCAASRSMIRRLRAESGVGDGAQATLDGSFGDLVQMTLEALVRTVTRFRPYLNEPQWGGVRSALEQLYRDAPGFDEIERFRKSVDQVRAATTQTLVEAARPEPNYMGGLEPVKICILLANDATPDILLDLLGARSVFNQKIASTESRADLAFLELASGATTRLGQPRHLERLATMIVDGFAAQDIDKQTWETLVRMGRSLQKKLPQELGGRATIALKQALDAAEGGKK